MYCAVWNRLWWWRLHDTPGSHVTNLKKDIVRFPSVAHCPQDRMRVIITSRLAMSKASRYGGETVTLCISVGRGVGGIPVGAGAVVFAAGEGGTGVIWVGEGGTGVAGAGDIGIGVPGADEGGTGVPGAGESGTGVPGAGEGGTGVPDADEGGTDVPGAVSFFSSLSSSEQKKSSTRLNTRQTFCICFEGTSTIPTTACTWFRNFSQSRA